MVERIAVVIGAAGEGLVGGIHDAARVHSVLTQTRFGDCSKERSILLSGCASRTEILDAVATATADWDPSNQLVFYYSGHGRYFNGLYHLQPGDERLPFDIIPLDLSSAGVRRAVIILDACESGSALKGTKNQPSAFTPESMPAGIGLVSSCRSDEWSYEHQDTGESIFTSLLCESIETGLDGMPTADGLITIEQSVTYIRKKLSSAAEYAEYPQVPVYDALSAEGPVPLAFNISGRVLSATLGSKVLTSTDETAILLDRNIHGLKVPVISATLDELDWDLVQQYGLASGRPESLEMDRDDLAEELGLYTMRLAGRGILHRAAVLCFAERPDRHFGHAMARFVTRSATSGELEIEPVYGPLTRQIDALVERTRRETASVITFENADPVQRQVLPEDVIREAISNAISHRDYEHPSMITVTVEAERVLIKNPGHFPRGLTFDDLIDDPRSYPPDPILANYLFLLLGWQGVRRGFTIFADYQVNHGQYSITGRQDERLGEVELTIVRPTAGRTDHLTVPGPSRDLVYSNIPRFCQFSELLRGAGLRRIDPESISSMWAEERGGSLRFPLGFSESSDLYIDLVQDGPHCLVGGTTGSGKSELLISMVASLATTYPPTRVNFLLLDYKGGAAFAGLSDLPHCVGLVTDLDGPLARRALISLRAELERREVILHSAGVKDLTEMIQRDPGRAPAALVVIVDEFATLATEIPEFIDGIVDIAQRGRSLGFHLVLATQRPSGVINSNIQANTNLRIALRQIGEEDSRDIIGVNDAANIPRPLVGRGYVRAGPEKPTEFQAAFSGANAHSEMADGGIEVSAESELTRLITAIGVAADTGERMEARPVWLQDLPNEIDLRVLHLPGKRERGESTLTTVGVLDEPENQRQPHFGFDFRQGPAIAAGAARSGKSTFLRTCAYAAILERNRHRDRGDADSAIPALSVVGLDFGSGGLDPLGDISQEVSIARLHDQEAVTRIIGYLSDVLEKRRAGATGNLPRPHDEILLLVDEIDAFAAVYEARSSTTQWLDLLSMIIEQGGAFNINSAVTTRRTNGFARVVNRVENLLVLRQATPDDYFALGLGRDVSDRTALPPGRGFLRSGQVVQLASIPLDESDGLINTIAPTAPSWLRSSVPAKLPDIAPDFPAQQGSLSIPIGIADGQSGHHSIDLARSGLVVQGARGTGKSQTLSLVAQQVSSVGFTVVTLASLRKSRSLSGEWLRESESFAEPIELANFLRSLSDDSDRVVVVADDLDSHTESTVRTLLDYLTEERLPFVISFSHRFRLPPGLSHDSDVLFLGPSSPDMVQQFNGTRFSLRLGLEMPVGRGVLVAGATTTVLQVSMAMEA